MEMALLWPRFASEGPLGFWVKRTRFALSYAIITDVA